MGWEREASEDNKQNNIRHRCSRVSSYKPWRLERTQIIACSWNRTEIDIPTKPCVWDLYAKMCMLKARKQIHLHEMVGGETRTAGTGSCAGNCLSILTAVFFLLSVVVLIIAPCDLHRFTQLHRLWLFVNPLTQSAVRWRWSLQITEKKREEVENCKPDIKRKHQPLCDEGKNAFLCLRWCPRIKITPPLVWSDERASG